MVGGHIQLVKNERYITTLGLASAVELGVGPLLEVINYTFTSLRANVVNDNSDLIVVAAPPLISLLEVVVSLSGSRSLSGTRRTP